MFPYDHRCNQCLFTPKKSGNILEVGKHRAPRVTAEKHGTIHSLIVRLINQSPTQYEWRWKRFAISIKHATLASMSNLMNHSRIQFSSKILIQNPRKSRQHWGNANDTRIQQCGLHNAMVAYRHLGSLSAGQARPDAPVFIIPSEMLLGSLTMPQNGEIGEMRRCAKQARRWQCSTKVAKRRKIASRWERALNRSRTIGRRWVEVNRGRRKRGKEKAERGGRELQVPLESKCFYEHSYTRRWADKAQTIKVEPLWPYYLSEALKWKGWYGWALTFGHFIQLANRRPRRHPLSVHNASHPNRCKELMRVTLRDVGRWNFNPGRWKRRTTVSQEEWIRRRKMNAYSWLPGNIGIQQDPYPVLMQPSSISAGFQAIISPSSNFHIINSCRINDE